MQRCKVLEHLNSMSLLAGINSRLDSLDQALERKSYLVESCMSEEEITGAMLSHLTVEKEKSC